MQSPPSLAAPAQSDPSTPRAAGPSHGGGETAAAFGDCPLRHAGSESGRPALLSRAELRTALVWHACSEGQTQGCIQAPDGELRAKNIARLAPFHPEVRRNLQRRRRAGFAMALVGAALPALVGPLVSYRRRDAEGWDELSRLEASWVAVYVTLAVSVPLMVVPGAVLAGRAGAQIRRLDRGVDARRRVQVGLGVTRLQLRW